MTISDGMGTELLLQLTSRPAGTYTSSPISYPGDIQEVELWVYASAVSASATVNCALESSPDGSTWSAVVGSGIPALSAVGSANANAQIDPSNRQHVRVTSTVGGTGSPSATYRAVVAVGSS